MNGLSNTEAFYEAAHLDPTRQRVYSSRRTGEYKFADVMIAGCQRNDWWYKDFIGVECFVTLHFSRYAAGLFLSDVTVVNLTNTKILTGRSIDPKDIMIL